MRDAHQPLVHEGFGNLLADTGQPRQPAAALAPPPPPPPPPPHRQIGPTGRIGPTELTG